MDKTFEYRLYPNEAQRALLGKTFGCTRWVYNHVLAMHKEEYAEEEKPKSIYSYMKLIPIWKKECAPWLAGT